MRGCQRLAATPLLTRAVAPSPQTVFTPTRLLSTQRASMMYSGSLFRSAAMKSGGPVALDTAALTNGLKMRGCFLSPAICGAFFQTQNSRGLSTLQGLPKPKETKTIATRGCLATSVREMSDWRLRPYAHAGTSGALPLGTLSAGFSKVTLSLLVLPWKALPTALVLAPMAWSMPLIYRMMFTNSSRGTTASVFTMFLYFVLSFMPVPCFENLFSELTWYALALFSTFFMYQFFPEVLLNDFMFMHYLCLFVIPLIPLAFCYMPIFASRAYFFL